MICTAGFWTVRKGREEDFARRWQETVDGLALEYPALKFRLFRDRANPQRFISFGEGWRSVEQVESARSEPSYQDALAAVWRLLDSGEIATVELVADVS